MTIIDELRIRIELLAKGQCIDVPIPHATIRSVWVKNDAEDMILYSETYFENLFRSLSEIEKRMMEGK